MQHSNVYAAMQTDEKSDCASFAQSLCSIALTDLNTEESHVKIQKSAEDYLESILVLQNRNGYVHAVDIANELEFSKPSVSVAMKNLRENGYIAVDRNNEITLTEKGRQIAETIYERHTLLTDWLKALGVDPAIAAEDACRMEHVISAESFAAIKRHAREHAPEIPEKE